MENKGFTLIELLMGLCLLGLIAVTILPSINSSIKASNIYAEKMDMMYLGEMAIEKIKAFKNEDCSSTYILDTKVEDIIRCFEMEDSSEMILNSKEEYKNYEIKLIKESRSNNLWKIYVIVSPIKVEERNSYVQYKALVPSK